MVVGTPMIWAEAEPKPRGDSRNLFELAEKQGVDGDLRGKKAHWINATYRGIDAPLRGAHWHVHLPECWSNAVISANFCFTVWPIESTALTEPQNFLTQQPSGVRLFAGEYTAVHVAA